MKFVKDTVATFSATILGVMLGLVSSILVARVLGPEGKGAYSLVMLIPTVLALVANMGIGVANAYFGGARKESWPDLVANSLTSAVVLGALAGGAFAAYYFAFHPHFLREVEGQWLVIGLLTVPFSLWVSYFNYCLLGQKRIRAYNVMQVVPAVLSLVLVAVTLALKMGVLGIVVASAVSTGFCAVLSLLLVLRATGISRAFQPRLLMRSARYGLQANLGNIIQFLNYRLDVVIVAYFMDVAAVGYYSIAVAMAEVLWYLPGTVGTLVFARTIGINSDDANRSTPRICRNTLFITIIAALVLFVLSRFVILGLYGSEFLPAVRPLWILLPGVVSLSICKILCNELASRGRPLVNAVAAAVSLAVNAPLNVLLIPRWGISGAAFASTVSYTVTAAVTLAVFTRISGNSWFDTLVPKPRDFVQLFAIIRSGVSRANPDRAVFH